jgi:hypothetical protein
MSIYFRYRKFVWAHTRKGIGGLLGSKEVPYFRLLIIKPREMNVTECLSDYEKYSQAKINPYATAELM